jgi:hypothetical protein
MCINGTDLAVSAVARILVLHDSSHFGESFCIECSLKSWLATVRIMQSSGHP